MIPFNSKEVTHVWQPQGEITVQTIEFANQRLIFIRLNGETDTTFSVTTPDSRTFYELSSDSLSDTFICDKVCLIGNSINLKLSVLVDHVAKLLYTNNENRNLLITLSSKILHPDKNDNDFEKLLLICQLLKQC